MSLDQEAMKTAIRVGLSLFCAMLVGCAGSRGTNPAASNKEAATQGAFISPEETRSKLIGTWLSDPAEKDFLEFEMTYSQDGTASGAAWPAGHPDRKIDVKFVWRLDGDILTTRIVDSNNRRLAPVGLKEIDRVLSIDEYRLKLQLISSPDEDGEERWVRKQ